MGTDLNMTAAVHHLGRARCARVLIAVLAVHAGVLGWIQHLAAPAWHTPNAPVVMAASVWTEAPVAKPAPRMPIAAPVPQRPAPTSASTPSASVPSASALTAPTPLEASPNAVSDTARAASAASPMPPPARAAETIVLPSADADHLHNPPPAYPRMSRRLGEQGTVVLRVRISAQGLPESVVLRTSSGYARLDQAALDAVLRWRFVPGQRSGVAEAMWFNVPVRFVLE